MALSSRTQITLLVSAEPALLYSRSRIVLLSQTVIGTPLFMAPEMWEGGAPYTSAADIWSFGCLIYELAALRPPFCAAK
jgi:serine/threonine protein kinase